MNCPKFTKICPTLFTLYALPAIMLIFEKNWPDLQILISRMFLFFVLYFVLD